MPGGDPLDPPFSFYLRCAVQTAARGFRALSAPPLTGCDQRGDTGRSRALHHEWASCSSAGPLRMHSDPAHLPVRPFTARTRPRGRCRNARAPLFPRWRDGLTKLGSREKNARTRLQVDKCIHALCTHLTVSYLPPSLTTPTGREPLARCCRWSSDERSRFQKFTS